MDAAFDLTNGLEIIIHAGSIRRAQIALETSHILAKGIQQTGSLLQGCLSLLRASTIAKERLKDHARMRLGWQWRGGRRPGKIVLIHAGIAIVALTHGLHQIHGELQRRQLSVQPQLLRRHLIHRGAQVIIIAFGVSGLGSTQERGVGGRMRTGIGVGQLHIGQHAQLVLDRLERLQDGGELRKISFTARGPARFIAPHGHEDKPEPLGLTQWRLGSSRGGGNHGIEHRKGHRGPDGSQEGASGQCFLGQDHGRVFLY